MEVEYGTIEREIRVDASPEIVFEVVSRPEHIKEWWSNDARFEPVEAASGELLWYDQDSGESMIAPIQVVEVDPPRRFAFRWCHTGPDLEGQSLLVTFDLIPTGDGTTIRMTETGFREMGWDIAVLEEQYLDHVAGWDGHLPNLATYVERIAAEA